MPISTNLDIRNTEKIIMVRLGAALDVTDDMALDTGIIYTVTPSFDVQQVLGVKRNGVAMTFTASASPANGQYNYNQDTNEIRIGSSTAPSSTTRFIVSFPVPVTTYYKPLEADLTGGPPELNPLIWSPRIITPPDVSESLKNIFAGVMTTSQTAVVCANADHYFDDFLDAGVSFHDQLVLINFYLNGFQNWTTESGIIGSMVTEDLSISGDTVRFTLRDQYSSALRKKAMFRLTENQAHFRNITGSFPNMDPSKDGRPIPIVFLNSPHRFKFNDVWRRTLGSSSTPRISSDNADTFEAVCTNFDTSAVSTSTNREWGICRTVSNFKTLDFGTIISDVTVSATFSFTGPIAAGSHMQFIYDASNPDHNLEIGDTFKYTDSGAAETWYCLVVEVNTVVFGGLRVAVVCDRLVSNRTVTLANSVFHVNDAPALVIKNVSDNQLTIPWYERDFAVSIVADATGITKYMKVTFVNDFENGTGSSGGLSHNGGAGVGIGILHPSTHQVFYRASQNSDDAIHDNVVEAIFESATSDLGLSITVGGIAGSDTTTKAQFSIPMRGEGSFGPYQSYLEKLLKSNLGFIKSTNNSTTQYTYDFFTGSSGISLYLDDSEVTSVSCSFDYGDIFNDVFFYNPQGQPLIPTDEYGNSETRTDSIYLFGNRPFSFDHVLFTSDSRRDFIADTLAARRVTYRIDVPNKAITTSIGQKIQLTSDKIAGTATSIELIVVSIKRSLNSVTLEAIELPS